ncbi:hypothetical protein DFH08DRAFT_931025 [Mycena albidolilacea]|uniref:Uncharacterized protein n=1 Tax=Mycena albidolilacea TaxID=1033008 RepID=A0AAD7AMR2_9AGAR|nr:hypothetical protein DFH08DRAFT_931025 [Mycena albidolilacea]
MLDYLAMGPWNLRAYLDLLSTPSIQTARHLDHNITNILPDYPLLFSLAFQRANFDMFGGSDSSTSKVNSDAPKRKRKGNKSTQPRKRISTSNAKGKGRATAPNSDSENGIRVTAKTSSNRVTYILDVTDTPELLGVGHKALTPDGYIKKECQDAWTGPTGSTAKKSLAKVVIFDSDEPVLCRRFYRSATEMYCKGKHLDSNSECGGLAILPRLRDGKKKGKTYLVGCSNWEDGDSDHMSKVHCFTPIPSAVRESILVKLFRGEPIDEEDDDSEVLAGARCQIIHPSHLPKNSVCTRNHYKDGVHVVAKLKKHICMAQISILVPIDGSLCAVVIPAAGVPHTHPSFLRTKVPAAVKLKYNECIEAADPVRITTLRVDKAPSTRKILDGKLPQEAQPSMINGRTRRHLVRADRLTKFPDGTGLPGIYQEFDNEQARDTTDKYIHSVITQTDGTHVIITINPELAKLTLEAIWIMVDTTFGGFPPDSSEVLAGRGRHSH